MLCYLVQHGEARPESEDPERPLTVRGREEVARVARRVASVGARVSRITHSGKLRAQQTAEILAADLEPSLGVRREDGLAPNDAPAAARRLGEAEKEPVMLVGHLPHLSRLAALLVTGDSSREVVVFRMGAIVCLERREEGCA